MQDEPQYMTIIDGKTTYQGQVVNGKKTGLGIYVDRSAHVECNGEWLDDNLHGKGTIRNYFDNFTFTGEFDTNQMVYGTMTWPDGTTYTGAFENNEMHGMGKLVWPNGMKYEGRFTHGSF